MVPIWFQGDTRRYQILVPFWFQNLVPFSTHEFQFRCAGNTMSRCLLNWLYHRMATSNGACCGGTARPTACARHPPPDPCAQACNADVRATYVLYINCRCNEPALHHSIDSIARFDTRLGQRIAHAGDVAITLTARRLPRWTRARCACVRRVSPAVASNRYRAHGKPNGHTSRYIHMHSAAPWIRARVHHGTRRAVNVMATSPACAMHWPRRVSKRAME